MTSDLPVRRSPGPDRRSRWRLGLGERLLGITLGVAVVAIVLTAWAVNRQTESELRGALRTEINKAQLVYNFFTTLAQETPRTWGDDLALARAAGRAADQYDVRVRLEYAVGDQLLWDTDSDSVESAPPRPALLPIRLVAPYSEQARADQNAEEVFRDCLRRQGISVQENVDPNGIVRYFANEPDSANNAIVTACSDERVEAAEVGPRNPDYGEDLLLYVVNPRLSSASELGDGINRQLVLTVLGVVLLAVLVTTVASRQILGPIARLTRASGRMAGGHLDERVPADRRDELGDLSRAFNSMAASIEEGDRQRRRLTSDIAHELRTPLSNIRGYLEAAQDGVAPITPALIDSLHEDTLLLQTLVTDLQELTVAESGGLVLQRSPTDLDELASSVAAAHLPRARAAGVDVTVITSAGAGSQPLTADVDPRRLRQVLTNLVENAMRHTSAGGSVTVHCRREGAEAVLEVADTGTGIAPEHLPHIFERFYRADPSRNRSTGGSGLGLAITRELVLAHGGTITPVSTVGVGTSFTVRLPLASASTSTSTEPTPPTPAAPPTPAGPPVRKATTGEPGSDRVARSHDHVDVN